MFTLCSCQLMHHLLEEQKHNILLLFPVHVQRLPPFFVHSSLFLCLFSSSLLVTPFSHLLPSRSQKQISFIYESFIWCLMCLPFCVRVCAFPVRDRVRTKMERDILVEVNHPFIVKLHYGESDNNRPQR